MTRSARHPREAKAAPRKLPLNLQLRVRTYDNDNLADVWLIRVDGAAHSGLLYGPLLADVAEELSKTFMALGLPVERVFSSLASARNAMNHPIPDPDPITKPGDTRPSPKRKSK